MEVMDGMGVLGGGEEVRGERQRRLFGDLSAEEGRLTRSCNGLGIAMVDLLIIIYTYTYELYIYIYILDKLRKELKWGEVDVWRGRGN
jgi:hypothetical protein